MVLKTQHQEGVGGQWNNFVHFNFAFSFIQKAQALYVLGWLPWELEKQSRGEVVPPYLCMETFVRFEFSVVWESHHDPLLRKARVGGRGTKPAVGRGLIVAFNNEWVLLRFLWNCSTELVPWFLASINPWAASWNMHMHENNQMLRLTVSPVMLTPAPFCQLNWQPR